MHSNNQHKPDGVIFTNELVSSWLVKETKPFFLRSWSIKRVSVYWGGNRFITSIYGMPLELFKAFKISNCRLFMVSTP